MQPMTIIPASTIDALGMSPPSLQRLALRPKRDGIWLNRHRALGF
jgi:hypothetical protein